MKDTDEQLENHQINFRGYATPEILKYMDRVSKKGTRYFRETLSGAPFELNAEGEIPEYIKTKYSKQGILLDRKNDELREWLKKEHKKIKRQRKYLYIPKGDVYCFERYTFDGITFLSGYLRLRIHRRMIPKPNPGHYEVTEWLPLHKRNPQRHNSVDHQLHSGDAVTIVDYERCIAPNLPEADRRYMAIVLTPRGDRYYTSPRSPLQWTKILKRPNNINNEKDGTK